MLHSDSSLLYCVFPVNITWSSISLVPRPSPSFSSLDEKLGDGLGMRLVIYDILITFAACSCVVAHEMEGLAGFHTGFFAGGGDFMG